MEQEQTVETKTDVTKKLSQKDAVFQFVLEALNEAGALPKEGEADASLKSLKEKITKDVRKVVRTRLFAAVKSGEVKLSKQFDDSKLKKYCSGLINNWLKKDSRFN